MYRVLLLVERKYTMLRNTGRTFNDETEDDEEESADDSAKSED